MTRIFNKASAKDIIVLFFSGHGYKGGFVGYDAMITYQDIKKTMAKSAAKNKMIFADACFCAVKVMRFLVSRENKVSI